MRPKFSFARNVSALLERTEYRRCDKGEDLEDIYRLRYKSYRLNDMVPEHPDTFIHDELDEAPNCYNSASISTGVLVSTLRIHHVTRTRRFAVDDGLWDISAPLLAAGDSFI